MPIENVEQPEVIMVDDRLRLRKFDGVLDFAFPWYQDPETVWLVDGVKKPYSAEKLEAMYRYLNAHGELYWIEAWQDGCFSPIGDVTFWQNDMPIVIGEQNRRGRKFGRQVVQTLIDRARQLGYQEIFVADIYDWNTASQKCFESVGFRPCEKTKHGHRYRLKL